MPDFTIVVGVDRKHLGQLRITFPNWARNKPSLLSHPMLAFYDPKEVTESDVRRNVRHPNLGVVPWDPRTISNGRSPSQGKWDDPQRGRMLAGFVHVPAAHVTTDYFLKLDTDTVAREPDDWIDESWFQDSPAIVAHAWSFTKPADQMLVLDEWAENHPDVFRGTHPLNLAPQPGWSRLGHRRIISWCGFFETRFTKLCSAIAGGESLPVPSQDGFMWYMATRLGRPVIRANLKGRGWEHWSTMRNIASAVGRK